MEWCPFCGRSTPYAERLYRDPACCGGPRRLGERQTVGLLCEDVLFAEATLADVLVLEV